MSFFEIIDIYAKQNPNRIVWEDDSRTYSISEIEKASGKIYRYLKDNGIGKEDIVAIRLPRSGRIPLVMLGVWKAGAAFVDIGERSPESCVSCQLNETKPKLIFDLDHFEAAMSCDELCGYERTDEHDLAFVVYSTGSSGAFKGSMHEYGALQKAINRTFYLWNQYTTLAMEASDFRVLLSAGFYTLTSVLTLLDTIVSRYYFYILPDDKIGNLEEIGKVLLEKKINSYLASERDLEYIKSLNSPYLVELSVSLDMISSVRIPDHETYNYYGMSESFCLLTCFKVDKPYDITPIGKPPSDILMEIADGNGNPVPDGTIGELCFVPEYWRGYISQPEKTKKVFYDGWFHTGDMAYLNEDGNMVVVGRKIDLMKTAQGYIVPIFISIAFNHAFPSAEKSHVQLFGGSEKPVICLYYCGNDLLGIDTIREKLKGKIPDYCLPTHCLRMDDFAYYPSGKLNRRAFPDPTKANRA